MSPRLLKFWTFLVEWEGSKFENDPDDPGNYVGKKLVGTKYGIDARSHPDVDIRNLTEARAQEIYQREYWQKYNCESYPYPMGEVIFNCAVNAGFGRVQKIILAIGSNGSASRFLDEQDAFYDRLAAARPASKKYLKGWHNRTRALRQFLKI